jgi:hypothetical protein
MITRPLFRLLRWSALLILLTGVGLWLGAGARIGWTQTSVATLKHDEITGITYPVRTPAFLPGVEIPLLALALAAGLAGLAWAGRQPQEARSR